MSKVITIAYSAVVAPNVQPVAEICRTFLPNNAACDLSTFNNTYYDTNVEGWGEGMAIETFFQKSIAHPGLIAALKAAMLSANHSYSFTTDDNDIILYMNEVTDALASQGFTITVADPVTE